MNKYQEDFDLVTRLCPLDGRERTILNYGFEEGRNKAIEEFAERLKDFIAKNAEDADSSNDLCCEIFQSEIDEIAESMKGEKE